MIEYAVPTLLIVFLIQTIAEGAWYPPYFRKGLLIYRRQLLLTSPVVADLSETTLETAFKSAFGPSLLFREIGPGEFAFRQPVVEFKLLTYTPVMLGLLRVEPHLVQVEGRANWFTIAFVGWVFAFVWQVRDAWPFLPFTALILTALYSFQARLYGRVGAFVVEAPAPPSPPTRSPSRLGWLIIAILVALWAGAGWYWFSH